MSTVIPDWVKEQERVIALLGDQANVSPDYYQYASPEETAQATKTPDQIRAEYDAAVARARAMGTALPPPPDFQYSPTGVASPTASADGKYVVDDNSKYGYFSQQNAQANTDYSVAMQEALARGDTAGYQQALTAYRANSGGLQPVWSYGINGDSIAANQFNPGSVSYGQPNPAVQYTLPGTVAATPQNTVTSGMYRDASGNLVGGTAPATATARTTTGTSINDLVKGGGRTNANLGDTNVATGAEAADYPTVPGSSGGYSGIGNPNINVGGGSGGGGNPSETNPTAIAATPITSTPSTPQTPIPATPITPTTPQNPQTPIPATPVTPTTPQTPGSPYIPPAGPRVQYPDSSFARQAFPTWSTWNDGSPYLGGDPGMMATSEANRAVDYGNLFQNTFGNAYADADARESAYRQTADNAYNDLYQNPGFTSAEADTIQNGGIAGGLNSLRATESQLNQNFFTPEEIAAIKGDPYSVYGAFDANSLNDIARSGTGATKSFFDTNYAAARNAIDSGQSRADQILGDYNTGGRTTLGQLRTDLYGAIDPTKLGISEAQVQQQKDSAARGIGAQYGATIDDLVRRAEAAGNVSPLALTAAKERLLREQSIQQQNAMTDAEVRIRDSQRAAEQDIANRRAQAGTTVGQAGLSLESDLANTGLNANQSMTGLRSGTEATYGNLGTNLGLSSTKQLTDAANTAGQTRIGQAQYADTSASNRAGSLAQNRQATSIGNANTLYTQGMGVADANSRNATAIGQQRITGQQAARNYWAGQNQFEGGQKNAAAGQQISGAQTSLSGQGQAGSTAVGNLSARRNPIQLGDIRFTL